MRQGLRNADEIRVLFALYLALKRGSKTACLPLAGGEQLDEVSVADLEEILIENYSKDGRFAVEPGAAASMLEELEAAKAKIDERPPAHEEPPASIADLFQPDMPLAPQALALQQLWVKLGHQVQRGEAGPDEIRKHERLSSEIEFINKHAFESV